jgi:multidrug resistance efflux pump
MQTYDEFTGCPGFDRSRTLYSPAQELSRADTPALLPPLRSGSIFVLARRLSTTTLGLGIAAVISFAQFEGVLQTPGVEAVVNARTITLRAPIDGEVQAGPNRLDVGTSLVRGDLLFRIINHHPDRSQVDGLTRQIEQLKDERAGVAARLANANRLLNDLTGQTRLFAEAHILQLEAREDELKAEVAAARARNEEAKISLDRMMRLASKGWAPMAKLNQAERDDSVAEKLQLAAQKRLEALSVELVAAKRGVFVGGSNNDRPRYMQRADELEQQVSNLAENLAERDQRAVRLDNELAAEKSRLTVLAATDVVAPGTGHVWEIMIAPEEQVHRGQDLLRVLDCGALVVTAVVGEGVHNRLQVGSPARFQPRDSQGQLIGRVILLTPTSATPANQAIQPSAPMRTMYLVTVTIPKLAEGQGCMIGRTGRMFFNDGPPEAMAMAAPAAL